MSNTFIIKCDIRVHPLISKGNLLTKPMIIQCYFWILYSKEQNSFKVIVDLRLVRYLLLQNKTSQNLAA